MEVVAGDLPFQRRNVVEWSHRDRLTGALELARRETNHWSASTASAIHNYGKVVDQRALNLADGRVQQTQRKQLEVFSTRLPGGSLQVIRSSTTSSSRSTVQLTQMGSGTWSAVPDIDSGFGDLKLSLHPLDLSSQKTRASVGRSIGWRRPPSRVARVQGGVQKDATSGRQSQEPLVEIQVEDEPTTKEQGNDNAPIISFPSDDDSSEKTTSVISSSSIRNSSSHSIVESRKSCSSENLVKVGTDSDVLANDSVGLLGRSSVLRRSLQYTRPADFPTGTSVRRMREEIEARGVSISGASSPLQAPSQVATSSELPLDKVKRIVSDSIASQAHSFVTVKSLNEVRGRLRSKGAGQVISTTKDVNGEDSEDVLVSEDHVLRRVKDSPAPSPRVQSYVFGMERATNERTQTPENEVDEKQSNNKLSVPNGLKSEEWYRRRKSYGFEHDLPPQIIELSSLKESKEDSWSDSGTFRSSVSFPVSSLLKHLDGVKRSKDVSNLMVRPASLYETPKKSEATLILNDSSIERNCSRFSDDAQSKKTVVNLIEEESSRTTEMDRRRDFLRRRTEREVMKQDRNLRNLTEPVSVTIPIISNDSFAVCVGENSQDKGIHPAEPALLINGHHSSDEELSKVPDVKRHSVAIVEARNSDDDDGKPDSIYREKIVDLDHTAHAYLSDSTEDLTQSRKKKVEFSKTEVHFAAEPGRFNLVSTDDKPPPTNIVRGRRRQKLLAEQNFNKSGLPEIRFGDPPLEKAILIQEVGNSDNKDELNSNTGAVITVTMEGVSSPESTQTNDRGKPRLLNNALDILSAEEKARGVVRCTVNTEQDSTNHVPMWRSTVTLKNNSFTNPALTMSNEKSCGGEAEFQRLLKSLRPTGRRDVQLPDITPDITVTTSLSPPVRPKGFLTKVNLGPPEKNGDSLEASAFTNKLSLQRSSSEHSSLHAVRMSRFGLESTPLVLLANRPRRLPRRPLPSEDEELSDDSIQADAEVRAYMVEKSKLVNLGMPQAAPGPDASPTGSSALSCERPGSYRHHASRAERLVQRDAPRETTSPNSVYIVPEQRKNGFTAMPRADFRSSPTQLPLSFSLVDSATATNKADASTQIPRVTPDYDKTVTVKDLLNMVAMDNKEAKDPPKERIIEIFNASASDTSNESSVFRNDMSRSSERLNGGVITNLGIFREQRPFSRELNGCHTVNISDHGPSVPLKPSGTPVTRHSPVPEERTAASEQRQRTFGEQRTSEAVSVQELAREFDRNRRHRRSPFAGQVSAEEHGRTHRPHIDVIEKFLSSERSHHDEWRPRRRERSRDQRRDVGRKDEEDRHRRSHSRERLTKDKKEASVDCHRNGVVEHRESSRDVRVKEHNLETRHRSRSREDHESHTARRSRSRDELERTEEDHSHETRRRCRSRGEHENQRTVPRSRSRDELERREEDHSHETRRRCRSRGEHESRNTTRRSRSRDELERTTEHNRDSTRRNLSRDELELIEDHSRTARHRSRSRDELERAEDNSHDTRRRRHNRDELVREEMSRNGRQRSRSRDELEVSDRSEETRRRSRSRDELRRRELSPEQRQKPCSRNENHDVLQNGQVELLVIEDLKKARNSDEMGRQREKESRVAGGKLTTEVFRNGKEQRSVEVPDRRHRCKCADRGEGRSTQSDVRGGEMRSRADHKVSRSHPNRGDRHPTTTAERRTKADRNEKGDKLVRKTRTHVAAMESPIAHIVKPSKERRQIVDVKKPGDVHIVIEPIRPVRRSGPGKQSNQVPAVNTKGLTKLTSPKRSSGNISEGNSTLSHGKSTPTNSSQLQSATEPLRERPVRRNCKKDVNDS